MDSFFFSNQKYWFHTCDFNGWMTEIVSEYSQLVEPKSEDENAAIMVGCSNSSYKQLENAAIFQATDIMHKDKEMFFPLTWAHYQVYYF